MKIEINDGIEEIWMPIKHAGFEKTHEISSLGNIRSFFPTQKNKTIPYIIKAKTYEDNILIARLYNEGHATKVWVAYEVLRAFGFEKKGNSVIAYKDNIKSHCSLSNLYFTKKPIFVKKERNIIIKVEPSEKSCKKCVFYKCFQNQDDGIHFKIDYAKNGCLKYKENILDKAQK